MKYLCYNIVLLLISCHLNAQTSTEIYLFDLTQTANTFSIENPINISNNEGYDSQPFFFPDSEVILFSSNRNGQTDLAKYSITTNQKSWILATTASEYSPTLSPNKKGISYIKLEENGTQLLWYLDLESQEEKQLIPNLKIGYHVWFDENTVVSFVLGEPHTLQVSHLTSQIHQQLASNIGRSLHKIPTKNLLSFVSKAEEKWQIKSLNPIDGTIEKITEIPFQVEDLTWTPTGDILISYLNSIYLYNSAINTWHEIINLEKFNLKGITRLAVSPNGKKLAVVVQGK